MAQNTNNNTYIPSNINNNVITNTHSAHIVSKVNKNENKGSVSVAKNLPDNQNKQISKSAYNTANIKNNNINDSQDHNRSNELHNHNTYICIPPMASRIQHSRAYYNDLRHIEHESGVPFADYVYPWFVNSNTNRIFHSGIHHNYFPNYKGIKSFCNKIASTKHIFDKHNLGRKIFRNTGDIDIGQYLTDGAYNLSNHLFKHNKFIYILKRNRKNLGEDLADSVIDNRVVLKRLKKQPHVYNRFKEAIMNSLKSLYFDIPSYHDRYGSIIVLPWHLKHNRSWLRTINYRRRPIVIFSRTLIGNTSKLLGSKATGYATKHAENYATDGLSGELDDLSRAHTIKRAFGGELLDRFNSFMSKLGGNAVRKTLLHLMRHDYYTYPTLQEIVHRAKQIVHNAGKHFHHIANDIGENVNALGNSNMKNGSYEFRLGEHQAKSFDTDIQNSVYHNGSNFNYMLRDRHFFNHQWDLGYTYYMTHSREHSAKACRLMINSIKRFQHANWHYRRGWLDEVQNSGSMIEWKYKSHTFNNYEEGWIDGYLNYTYVENYINGVESLSSALQDYNTVSD